MTITNSYRHVIIDGTRVPIVSGGAFDDPPGIPDDLGAPPGGMDTPPADPTPTPTPTPPPADPALPPSTPPTPPAAPPEGYIPRDAYDRLMQQDRARRERYQPYEQVFSRLDSDRAEALLALAEMYADDPDNATQFLASIFGQDPSATPPPGTPPGTPAAAQFLTRDDLDNFFRERDQQAQQARMQQESSERLKSVAKDLGYEYGTPGWRHLVDLAQHNFRTDEFGVERDPMSALKLAAEYVDKTFADFRQASIDEYVKGKPNAPTPITAGEPASGETIPTNMEESRRAFEAATFGPQ